MQLTGVNLSCIQHVSFSFTLHLLTIHLIKHHISSTFFAIINVLHLIVVFFWLCRVTDPSRIFDPASLHLFALQMKSQIKVFFFPKKIEDLTCCQARSLHTLIPMMSVLMYRGWKMLSILLSLFALRYIMHVTARTNSDETFCLLNVLLIVTVFLSLRYQLLLACIRI